MLRKVSYLIVTCYAARKPFMSFGILPIAFAQGIGVEGSYAAYPFLPISDLPVPLQTLPPEDAHAANSWPVEYGRLAMG